MLKKNDKFYDIFHFRKKCFFVDLFVRVSNDIAVNMYKNLGYVIYRTVLEYYSGDPDEDGYGKFLFQVYFLLSGSAFSQKKIFFFFFSNIFLLAFF